MRTLSLIVVVLLGLTAGCADLKDLSAFSAALSAEYHLPANVNLNNGSHLRITFQNPPAALASADNAARERFAREVATFTKAHYPRSHHQLESITIAFAQVSSYGPVSVTRTNAPFSFRVEDLPAPDAAPPPKR